MREVDFQLVIQKDHELYAMLQLNIPKFVSRYNDILFEKRDYQTKRPPIVSPPGCLALLQTCSPLVADAGFDGGGGTVRCCCLTFFRSNEFVLVQAEILENDRTPTLVLPQVILYRY